MSRLSLLLALMDEARKRFLAGQGLEPTTADINGYLAFQRRAMQEDRQRRAAERDTLQQELAQAGIDDVRRSQLTKSIAAIDELDAMTAETPAATAQQREELENAQRAAAALMVGSWRFNQGLYRKYGGRVAFQQAGLEPVDTHKAFLEELKTSGAYTIIDPAYQDLFKETEVYFGKDFDYVPKDQADDYFSLPWWLKEGTSDPSNG